MRPLAVLSHFGLLVAGFAGRAEGGIKATRPLRPIGRMRVLTRLGGLLILLSLALAPLPAFAVNPDEVLADPALEQRARNLSSQLRCMVCQNQSIDDSNAELARDLRLLVRDRIVKGETDDEVIQYVVSRYGEFVLLNPRLSWRTYALWSAPALLFLAGCVALFVYSRSGSRRQVDRLTAEEEARLEKLLQRDGENP